MSDLLKPPAVPVAILNFFASQPDFPAVAGDISEEFHQRVLKSGATAAKRWYWREVIRNAWALTGRELVRTPVRTTLIALGCYLGAYVLVELYAFLRYYNLPGLQLFNDQRHWNANLLVNFIACLGMGRIGGSLLRGRECALAITVTLISACLALPGAWYVFFVLKELHPPHLREFVVTGTASRLSAFWLGSLWIRVRSRSFAATSVASGTPQSSAPRNPPDLS